MNAAEVFLPGLDQGPCVQGPQGVEQAAGAPPLLLACAAAGWCSSGWSTPPAAWQSLSVLLRISISWQGTRNIQVLPLLLCYWHITCLGSSQSPDKKWRGTAFTQQQGVKPARPARDPPLGMQAQAGTGRSAPHHPAAPHTPEANGEDPALVQRRHIYAQGLRAISPGTLTARPPAL